MTAAAQRKPAPRPDTSKDASSLVGAYVWATPLDDLQYRHEMHKGLVMAEKKSGGILWVQFKADTLVGQKWIPAHKIKGRAQYVPASQTVKATA
jgi:hypothetical protein